MVPTAGGNNHIGLSHHRRGTSDTDFTLNFYSGVVVVCGVALNVIPFWGSPNFHSSFIRENICLGFCEVKERLFRMSAGPSLFPFWGQSKPQCGTLNWGAGLGSACSLPCSSFGKRKLMDSESF